MTSQPRLGNSWSRAPVVVRAVLAGLLIALLAANVWPLLLFNLPVPVAAAAELIFLSLYVLWASGRGYPRSNRIARRAAFRTNPLSLARMAWGLGAAACFAIAVHTAIVVLFRLVPFPRDVFRRGY